MLADFARTKGAKDKKKRKRRGIGKALAISGAALGGAALGGAGAVKLGVHKAFKNYKKALGSSKGKDLMNRLEDAIDDIRTPIDGKPIVSRHDEYQKWWRTPGDTLGDKTDTYNKWLEGTTAMSDSGKPWARHIDDYMSKPGSDSRHPTDKVKDRLFDLANKKLRKQQIKTLKRGALGGGTIAGTGAYLLTGKKKKKKER